MVIPRTWVYRGENCTVRDLACIKGCRKETFTKLLKEVPPGTEIDSIVDNRRVKLILKYRYRGTLYTITELVNMTKLSRAMVYGALKDIKNFSEVDSIIDSLTAPYYVVYKGKKVNKKELAKLVGISVETLCNKLEDIPSGTDVTDINFNIEIRRVIYDGELYTVPALANMLGVQKGKMYTWLRNVKSGTDVTNRIKERNVSKRWMYRGELRTINGIKHLCGRSRNFVANTLVGIKENECVDDLIDRDTSSRWECIDWNGTQKSLIDLATDYGIPRNNLYYECQTHGTKKLKEYIDSYGGDRRLRIVEKHRLFCDWICDDLWVYKDPETEEEQVLTTKEINSLCENRSSDLEVNSEQ